jgi:hypothetical protein
VNQDKFRRIRTRVINDVFNAMIDQTYSGVWTGVASRSANELRRRHVIRWGAGEDMDLEDPVEKPEGGG